MRNGIKMWDGIISTKIRKGQRPVLLLSLLPCLPALFGRVTDPKAANIIEPTTKKGLVLPVANQFD